MDKKPESQNNSEAKKQSWKFGDYNDSNIPSSEESTLEKVKNKIKGEFRKKKLGVGGTLDLSHRAILYREHLNPKEQELFKEAANSLIKEGFISVNSRNDLVLTQKGKDSIYGGSTLEKVKNKIKGEFRKKKLGVGGTLDISHLDILYREHLNPKEQELFEEAVNSLINEGFISKNSRNDLALTQKGKDSIYGGISKI